MCFPICNLFSFQYNAWAVPCNNKIECDMGIDESFCNTPSWHKWIALASILTFFIMLFCFTLKSKFKKKEKKQKEKEKEPGFKMQPVQCQHSLLDRKYRARLVLRLQNGRRKEAIKVYDQLQKEEFFQILHLKVCSLTQ